MTNGYPQDSDVYRYRLPPLRRMPPKPWWHSRTVWAVVGLVAMELWGYVATINGWPEPPSGVRMLLDGLLGVGAIYGRAKADRPLGGGR